MIPDMLFSTANTIANARVESGEIIAQEETICVIQTNSGRIYSGVSYLDNMGAYVHAEIEAIRNMQIAGENSIIGLLLISTFNRIPMLPCSNCMSYIMSLGMDNQSIYILMADRMINIAEASAMAYQNPPNGYPVQQPRGMQQPIGMQPLQPNGFQPQYGMQPPQANSFQPQYEMQQQYAAPDISVPLSNSDSFKGDVLKNKVKNLLEVTEESEEEIKEKENEMKKELAKAKEKIKEHAKEAKEKDSVPRKGFFGTLFSH